MPPARYSSTSYTVMRVPLIHGFPPRTAGFTAIRSCQLIREILPLVLGCVDEGLVMNSALVQPKKTHRVVIENVTFVSGGQQRQR
jgi:hypothetical protein